MSERLDPLLTAQRIEDSYKRYLKTLLAPSDPSMAVAFANAIDASHLLTKGPLLELTPPYALGSTPRQLIEDGTLHPAFERLDSKAIPLDRALYVHQETAIRKLVAGRNLVVSTGTGSGKTESFLIPILNALLTEQSDGDLGPGVRALLLYPMNALANDQLKRLREVLKACPEITFGRYTGETTESARDAETEFAAANPGAPRLPNELLSREEMRKSPPHLLLTNYAMLEYLLLRPADIELFDGQYTGRWRFLILDEAHVYDGAQGSEVALLLRRLNQRVAPAGKLQCVATSASLEGSTPEAGPREAMKFASDLFNAEFDYAATDPDKQDLVRPTRQESRSSPTWQMTDEQIFRLGTDGDLDEVVTQHGGASPAEALHNERTVADLKAALAAGPVEVAELQERLWPEDQMSAKKLESLVALGSKVFDADGNPVLSGRYHMFVRATEGAFVSFADSGPRIFLGRHEVDPETGHAVFEFGTCQRCGAIHLAGDVAHRNKREYFLPSTKDDSSVRWLVMVSAPGDTVLDEDDATLSPATTIVDPTLRTICSGCGCLGATSEVACKSDGCPGGTMLTVREHRAAAKIMSRCTECGAQARQVIRRLRTDRNAAPAVVTTALYQQLPTADDESVAEVGGGRKLLMFSDSRQAAAFAAPYLDRTYGRLLERRYLMQALFDRKYIDEELTPEDLGIVARRKADEAGHFPDGLGRVKKEKAANEWVIGELIAMDVRQSLEGLCLMRVSLQRGRDLKLPKAFASIGLSEEEAWALLNELVKSARSQGAMSLLDEVDIQSERFEPRNARIRMRSRGSDAAKRIISWLPTGTAVTNKRICLVNKIREKMQSPPSAEQILEGCWNYLVQQGFIALEADRSAGDVYQVQQNKLSVSSGTQHDWYQCDTCRHITAFSIRAVCPNSSCKGELRVFQRPPVETDTNHYRVVYQTMNTAPLTSREHTAQWDAREAASIQKDFIAGRVNVLSCSTTFELGVDVGDLQSVVMRNMPPKTANYVQRAGRAGRRAAAAALVVTYANRAAHDLAKYQYPQSMISGRMRIPWIPVDNPRIARRHAHSVAMAAYFRRCAQEDGATWKHAGPFFVPPIDGDSPASRVKAFLTPIPDDLRAALLQVIPPNIQHEVGVLDGSWAQHLIELLEKVESEVRNDVKLFHELIDAAIAEKKLQHGSRLQKTLNTIEQRQLLGFLATKNVLPKYGFPVDTVELRTLHCAEPVGRNLELGRDLTLAIYEYAPGNEVVAGGKVWTSRGLRRLPGRELDEFEYQICTRCSRFKCARRLDAAELCQSCGDPYSRIRKFVLPEFGFVADRSATDVGTAPPERRWVGSSFVEDVGDEVETHTWKGDLGTAVSARAGQRATLAVISEGSGGGFQVCDWCGWAQPTERTSKKKQRHERPESGNACDGPLRVVSLGHRYQTDVVEFTISGLAYSSEAEAAWLSTLYAVLEGASEALEISRDDINGTLSWGKDGGRSLVLFDTVPGGAGAAKKIAENVELVLRSALDRVKQCDCGPETSCYGCLRSYRNAKHHDQLSRRGALSIFSLIGIKGLRSEMSTSWGAKLDMASDSVQEILGELARQGCAEPEVGVELGKDYWPVEAVWPDRKIVIVDGADAERDACLAAEGFDVRNTDTVDALDLVEGLLS